MKPALSLGLAFLIDKLANWQIGELANWRIGELANWRIGELSLLS